MEVELFYNIVSLIELAPTKNHLDAVLIQTINKCFWIVTDNNTIDDLEFRKDLAVNFIYDYYIENNGKAIPEFISYTNFSILMN